METRTWKYVENSFEANTRTSRAKMDKIVVDHHAKLSAAAVEEGADPGLATLLERWTRHKETWTSAYNLWKNTKANYSGGTRRFENLLRALQIKPGSEQDSKIENWDNRIRTVAPKGSAVYATLLPRGRAPFTERGRDNIVNEVRNLGTRLSQQSNETLTAIGTEVTAFYDQLDSARHSQQGLEGDTGADATEIEAARKKIAAELYRNLGMLMYIYADTPERVATFFDLETLRQPAPAKPASQPAPEQPVNS